MLKKYNKNGFVMEEYNDRIKFYSYNTPLYVNVLYINFKDIEKYSFEIVTVLKTRCIINLKIKTDQGILLKDFQISLRKEETRWYIYQIVDLNKQMFESFLEIIAPDLVLAYTPKKVLKLFRRNYIHVDTLKFEPNLFLIDYGNPIFNQMTRKIKELVLFNKDNTTFILKQYKDDKAFYLTKFLITN